MALLTELQRLPGLTVSVAGPAAAVRRVQAVTRDSEGQDPWPGVRFVGAVVGPDDDPRDHFAKTLERSDAVLFTGPLQFDLAVDGSTLPLPATFVAATEASLYAAMVRAIMRKPFDLRRATIDSLTLAQVQDAYRELGLDAERATVAPYQGPASVDDYVRFHRDAFEAGHSELALTTRHTVARDLRQIGVPVEKITPTLSTIRGALETAVTLAGGARLEEQQVAFVLVQVLTGSERPAGEPTAYWEQAAALSVHRALIEEARLVGGVVQRRSDLQFMVTTTHGGLQELTDRLTVAPFVEGVRSQLRIPIAVGLAAGRTAVEAESRAGDALTAAVAADGRFAVYLDVTGARRELASSRAVSPSPHASATRRDRDIADRLEVALGERDIDVDDVARVLGVTTRTGHRVLASLVEAGLAWPLPTQTSTGGRPKKKYHLLFPTRAHEAAVVHDLQSSAPGGA